MSRKLKVVLSIILALILAVGWFTYIQWNNISAFIDALRYSNEDVIKIGNENKQEVEKYLEEEEGIKVRDLTKEESEAFKEGDLTEKEVIDLITGRVPSEKEPQEETPSEVTTQKPVEEKPKEPVKPTEPDSSSRVIEEQIAKLYVQKSIYLGKLDAIEAQAMAEYVGLQEAGIEGSKKEFLAKYLPIVANWEKTCDSTVFGIINTIRAELEKGGKNTDIADKLKEAYLAEKKTKKSYFINRYMD